MLVLGHSPLRTWSLVRSTLYAIVAIVHIEIKDIAKALETERIGRLKYEWGSEY